MGSNEHEVLPELTVKIRQVVANLNPDHINALQPFSLTFKEFEPIIPHIKWVNADVFHNASEVGELSPLFKSLQGKDVTLISCADKKQFNPSWSFIEVRPKNSFLDYQMVLDKVFKSSKDKIFLFAASRMSVPVIYDGPNDCTMIDIGSLLDPFVGNIIRGYHKRMTKDIIKKNLE